jgi:hypothetical protein
MREGVENALVEGVDDCQTIEKGLQAFFTGVTVFAFDHGLIIIEDHENTSLLKDRL